MPRGSARESSRALEVAPQGVLLETYKYCVFSHRVPPQRIMADTVVCDFIANCRSQGFGVWGVREAPRGEGTWPAPVLSS